MRCVDHKFVRQAGVRSLKPLKSSLLFLHFMQLIAQLAAFTTLSVQLSSTTCIARPLLKRLCRFHYLDAGLNCRGAYLTDPEVWLALGQWIGAKRQGNGSLVIIHGTPRQWSESVLGINAILSDIMINFLHCFSP
jgi:hypothetical protein